MILVLVRHAPAEDLTDNINDFERRLTDHGRKKMEKAAAGLAVMLLKESGFCICSSPKLRSLETAKIVADYLKVDHVVTDDRLEEGVPEELLQLVEDHSDKKVLIITGHEPWISGFSDYLSRQELPYRKGAAAAFKLETGWQDNGARLLWFMQPRALRRLSTAYEEIMHKKE